MAFFNSAVGVLQTLSLIHICAYHRNYSREYRAKNLEKQREYDRMKAREYRARRKAQACLLYTSRCV